MNSAAHLATLFLTTCFLVSCGSTPESDPNGLDRPMSQRLQKWDTNRKSPFDKQFNTGKKGHSDVSGMMGSKAFHTTNFGGNKSFSGMKNFSTKEYSQGGNNKSSRYATQESSFGKKESRYATSSYAAKDSALGAQSASQGSHTFRSANQAFGTGDYRDAAKSMKENNRPMIIQGELEAGAKTSFTEAEIKQMVNR
jgi:hypothetical protein